MKVRELVGGIVSGYAGKGVHFLVSIALVPFYLRDDILGLDGYGLVFTILAATQIATLFTNGVRLAFVRSVAQAIRPTDDGGPTPGEALGSGTKVLLVLCTPIALAFALGSGVVLSLLGIEVSADTQRAMWLAAAFFWAENAFPLLQAPLMTRGAISFVNTWLAIEAVIRAAAMVLLLGHFGGSLAIYFAVYFAMTMVRHGVFLVRLRLSWPGDVEGALRAPLVHAMGSLRYSLPVSLQWGANLLVERAPIVLATRFLGPEISGFVAIVVNTIRGYFIQMLFTVLQPIAVPVGALLDPARLSESERRSLWDIESVYTVAVGITIFSASAVMPTLLRLWLGDAFLPLAFPTQMVLVGSAVELSLTLRRSILLGQGRIAPAAVRSAITAALAILAAIGFAVVLESWQWLVGSLAGFLAVSSIWGNAQGFRRAFGRFSGPHWIRPLLFLLVCAGVSISLSHASAQSGLAGAALSLAINAAVTLIAAHFLLIPLRRMLEMPRKLLRAGDRNLFPAPETPAES